MSYLEELRHRAAVMGSETETDLTNTQARLNLARATVVPQMRQLYRQLSELRQLLDELRPSLQTSYHLQNIATFRDLAQGHYTLWSNPGEEDERFVFQYAYSRPGSFNYRLASKDDADKLREWLWLHGFRFESLDTGASVFSINYHVPVSFEFTAVLEKSAIQLRMKNARGVGTVSTLLNPGNLPPRLIDELAKLVMHEPSDFAMLTGNALTNEQREWIRSRVEAERQASGSDNAEQAKQTVTRGFAPKLLAGVTTKLRGI